MRESVCMSSDEHCKELNCPHATAHEFCADCEKRCELYGSVCTEVIQK